jgi:NAD(P)-dependent dehydrogenase (short-subunit alcohol dehydrogenase family)
VEPVVCLVTGCSFPGGFGARASRMLAGRGHRVYAGVLDPAHDPAVDTLSASGVEVVPLDVTDDD